MTFSQFSQYYSDMYIGCNLCRQETTLKLVQQQSPASAQNDPDEEEESEDEEDEEDEEEEEEEEESEPVAVEETFVESTGQ